MNDEILLTEPELPIYQRCECKQVWAFKIGTVEEQEDSEINGYILVPEDNNYPPIRVNSFWVCIQQPQEGGYYVVSKVTFTVSGYHSQYIGAKEFEKRYTRI